ncbi:hypothetical protein F2P81_000427 [Scophthalmus maximus]|uniref:Uncharacterized protein n=1 Tax=Scophthalmus maximus TaxID=52904 RepID=A0A6A4TUA8_SCOMX|nr:hypothetical protein F2P81_000427 [Scophthalmus maximus]
MGSVTSAFTRTRNALVKVGSEPEGHDAERSHSAPESARAKKKSARFPASIQAARQSSRQSLSEVLSRQDADGAKQTARNRTPEAPPRGESVWSQSQDVPPGQITRWESAKTAVVFASTTRYNDGEMTAEIKQHAHN